MTSQDDINHTILNKAIKNRDLKTIKICIDTNLKLNCNNISIDYASKIGYIDVLE